MSGWCSATEILGDMKRLLDYGCQIVEWCFIFGNIRSFTHISVLFVNRFHILCLGSSNILVIEGYGDCHFKKFMTFWINNYLRSGLR